ncbi:ABC transporter permease [Neobacillus niacini]|uniref:YhgE/Pip domain-containing protein n=1 Tax=Neobacillus niacini TaxID=86668 RepID=UPI002FFE73AC
MKRLFKLSSTWFPIWCILLLMLVMVAVYIPVFGGSNQNLTDVPLIIVNEDKGKAGDAILLNLIEAQNGNSFKWDVVKTKDMAVSDLKDNKAYGALVIPADYSVQLSQVHELLISGKGFGKPAKLGILLNEGVGQSASLIASNTLQTVVKATSNGISSHFKSELIQKGTTVSPMSASLLDRPVQFTTKNVLGLSVNLNKGMTPFVMSIIASITGLVGANMIRGYLVKSNGILRKKGSPLPESQILASALILAILLAFFGSVILQLSVFGFFGSTHASSIWYIFLFSFFCCLTMLFLFKAVALLLGGWGILVMFPINFMGIFSSGGAFPLSTLPPVHRLFSFILPTRYMVDGMRALLYYQGRMQAGLSEALWALSIYFVVSLAIIIAFISIEQKREREHVAAIQVEKVGIQLDNELHYMQQAHNTTKNDENSRHDKEFRNALKSLHDKDNK